MKIQKAEMEFITFDANDVIATSFSKVSYITGTTNYPGLSGYLDDPQKTVLVSSGEAIGESNKYYIVAFNNATEFFAGKYQGATQTNTVENINTIPGYQYAELDPIDINTFENFAALIDWLNSAQNGLKGQ